MAKRRKTSRKKTAKKSVKKALRSTASSSLYQTAERAVVKQSNRMLTAATKQYKKLVRQAAKATNDRNKRKYLAAALSAVAIAGVVANDMRKRIDKAPVGGRKKKRL